MKNGLFEENGELIYYKSDKPYHAGVVSIDGDIYYISSRGRAVKGHHIVHGEMTNGILKRGTYEFGDDYKLIEGSYIPAKKHSKSKRKRRSKSKKIKNSVVIVSCCVALVAIILIAMTELGPYRNIPKSDKSDSTVHTQVPVTKIEMPTFDSEVLLCSESAKKLYDGEITANQAVALGDAYVPFVFNYRLGNENGILYLNEANTSLPPKEFTLSYDKDLLVIDNLKTNTMYEYRVTVGKETFNGNFKTAESSRFVNLSGAYNTRDIGGYKTTDGKIVKQGMLVRGTEIDGLVETTYYLDDKGLETAINDFGFVYDFDLRNDGVFIGDYESRLGENVGHKFYSAPAYGMIFNNDNRGIIKDIFNDLAKEDNYPMYLHCTYGSDRTGTIVYLLQGILGVPEEKLDMEYKLSGFVNPELAETENLNVIKSNLEKFKGDTINEKIENYLINGIGVSKEEIESIRDIFLDN